MLCEVPSVNVSKEELLERAFEQLKEGYFEDAIETFTDCILLQSEESRAYYGRAFSNFQLGKWSVAADDFSKAKELNPEDKESWLGLAMSLAMDNKIYQAISIFETLLDKYPNFVRGHIQLGNLYYRLGVITKGHQQLDLALTRRPSLEERRLIESLQKEQKEQDKKRYYRPDFEALRAANMKNQSSDSWIEKIKRLFKKNS